MPGGRRWTTKEDDYLDATVRECVDKDQDETVAFEVAGKILNRTTTACNRRWHRELRVSPVRNLRSTNIIITEPTSNYDKVDQFMQALAGIKQIVTDLQIKNQQLTEENKRLQNAVNEDIKKLAEAFINRNQLGV